ncbi:MAG: hypothetical protein RIC93_03680 [Alphaproteobacteria bacterium]
MRRSTTKTALLTGTFLATAMALGLAAPAFAESHGEHGENMQGEGMHGESKGEMKNHMDEAHERAKSMGEGEKEGLYKDKDEKKSEMKDKMKDKMKDHHKGMDD